MVVARQLLDQESARLRSLHERLKQDGVTPTPWVRDLRAMAEDRLGKSLGSPALAPRDLAHVGDEEAQAALTQSLSRQFGALLDCWPAVWDAARAYASADWDCFLSGTEASAFAPAAAAAFGVDGDHRGLQGGRLRRDFLHRLVGRGHGAGHGDGFAAPRPPA